jgi:enoyl-CoA hydratase/carnithine racemase
MSDVHVSHEEHVAIVEIGREPNNYFDEALIRDIASAFEACDINPNIRSIVLCAKGKNFCAGANFLNPGPNSSATLAAERLYQQAIRLFRCEKPIVAAVQGAAVGGGLGLALVADFRIASSESRFTANFNRIGFHPGFGLTVTLPRVIGEQRAALLFYTGRRISGDEAQLIGLVDVLVSQESLKSASLELATEIARSAPIAVVLTRRTLRRGLADRIAEAIRHELAEQERLLQTEDFAEGVKAMNERRLPIFVGR